MNKFRLSDLALRPLAEADLEMVLRWRNDDRVRRNMYTDHVISMEEHRAWFARMSADPAEIYLIFSLKGRDVGVVSFNGIKREHARCFWAFYLGEAEVPRGTGSAMEYLALNYAFDDLELHKLSCEVIAFNTGVIKLHKRFGFGEEGRFVDDLWRDGQPHDVVRLALFRHHWLQSRHSFRAQLFEKE